VVNFFLQGDITPETALPLVNEIEAANREFRPQEQFTLHICSAGGDVEHGLSIFSLIQTLRRNGRKFNTHVAGKAYSMGAVLVQAGMKRTIDPYSLIMLHRPKTSLGESFEGHEHDYEREAMLVKETRLHLATIISSRTKLPVESVLSEFFMNDDVYLNAVRALEYGLVDEILTAP
jgi:ATP-dependent Clp endopeptidase proteolytic subunit ClpP